MLKYRLCSALVCSGPVNLKKETFHIIKASKNNRQLYVLMRADLKSYKSPMYSKYMEKMLRTNSQVVGMKINPSTERHRVTEDVYTEPLEVLNDYGGVLLLHCGRWVEMSGWHYGVETAKKYTKIKVIFAHMGGTHPDLSFKAIEAAKTVNNIWMDTSQTRQLVVLKRAIQKLGAEKILFGSDMPWGNYLQNLVGILELNLSEAVLNKVLRENFNKIVKGE